MTYFLLNERSFARNKVKNISLNIAEKHCSDTFFVYDGVF